MAGRHGMAGGRGGAFDALDLALRGASLAGALDEARLPRVADRLARGSGRAAVSWQITGKTDALGRPALEIGLEGAVPLVCQRCLQAFVWPVAQRTLVLLARDERELAVLDAEDEHEVVLADGPLDPAMLAEDELLLTLPFAPHCERDECAAMDFTAGDSVDGAPAPSAFAALVALKKGPGRKAKQ